MEYEVTIEQITPCGGNKHATREIVEVEANTPMEYVMANKRFPDVTVISSSEDETVIVASNSAGYKTRYTFMTD